MTRRINHDIRCSYCDLRVPTWAKLREHEAECPSKAADEAERKAKQR